MMMMSTAKPYATAAFDLAVGDKRLDAWSQLLSKAALIVGNKDVHRLLCDPRVSQQDVLDIFFDVLKKDSDDKSKRFLELLMKYERLDCLPAIAIEFHELLAVHHNTMSAQVRSAVDLSAAEKKQLETVLSKQFDAKITIECEVDKGLLAGAVIRVGDTVIDGSMRGRLQRFGENLLEQTV
jgi:F-type H+-transporting ATPase subunit delta